MFYIGQSIEIPEEIIKEGSVNINKDESGQPFDWRKVHDGLIFIRSSKERPRNTHVSGLYKGYWYYIPDSDIVSKETLTMLKIVLTLKAGGIPSKAPVLTLDVDG